MSRRMRWRDYVPPGPELWTALREEARHVLARDALAGSLIVVVSLLLILSAGALAGAAVREVPRHPVVVERPARRMIPAILPRSDVKARRLPVPTPVFAAYGKLQLHLPVAPGTVSLIAFHQSGGSRPTLHMRSMVEPTKLSELAVPAPVVKRNKATAWEAAEIAEVGTSTAPAIYRGKVIRLYRTGRSGEADTAADCGSKGGAQVFAPVDGMVVAVRRYQLYGQYTDYEIHIIPTGFPLVDVTILHTAAPSVREGEQVTAGVTPIAKVRWLSRLFESQLDEYTHDGGNHVHIQLDRAPAPGVVRLLGSAQEAELKQR